MVKDLFMLIIKMNILNLDLLLNFVFVYIVSKYVGEKLLIEDYNVGCVVVGMGLYKFVLYVFGDCVVMVCNDNYWGGK